MLLFEANAICETIDGWVKKKTDFKITSFLAALLNLSKNTVSKRKAKDHKISLVRQNTMHDRSLLWHHAYVQLELDDIIVIT